MCSAHEYSKYARHNLNDLARPRARVGSGPVVADKPTKLFTITQIL
jgi:hypothetical protein